MNMTEKIKHRYNTVAPLYDCLEVMVESWLFKQNRRILLPKAQGRVLEVGVGTGKNLEYYPPDIELIAIDFSDRMLDQAQHRVDQGGGKIPKSTQLLKMDVQSLAFAENTFDTVVSTCVFCSVPDPVKGLKEIRRVCKSSGTVLMLEHVRSQHKMIGQLMDWFNFIPLHIYGANINRDTISNLQAAGFSECIVNDLWFDILKQIEIKVIKQ